MRMARGHRRSSRSVGRCEFDAASVRIKNTFIHVSDSEEDAAHRDETGVLSSNVDRDDEDDELSHTDPLPLSRFAEWARAAQGQVAPTPFGSAASDCRGRPGIWARPMNGSAVGRRCFAVGGGDDSYESLHFGLRSPGGASCSSSSSSSSASWSTARSRFSTDGEASVDHPASSSGGERSWPSTEWEFRTQMPCDFACGHPLPQSQPAASIAMSFAPTLCCPVHHFAEQQAAAFRDMRSQGPCLLPCCCGAGGMLGCRCASHAMVPGWPPGGPELAAILAGAELQPQAPQRFLGGDVRQEDDLALGASAETEQLRACGGVIVGAAEPRHEVFCRGGDGSAGAFEDDGDNNSITTVGFDHDGVQPPGATTDGFAGSVPVAARCNSTSYPPHHPVLHGGHMPEAVALSTPPKMSTSQLHQHLPPWQRFSRSSPPALLAEQVSSSLVCGHGAEQPLKADVLAGIVDDFGVSSAMPDDGELAEDDSDSSLDDVTTVASTTLARKKPTRRAGKRAKGRPCHKRGLPGQPSAEQSSAEKQLQQQQQQQVAPQQAAQGGLDISQPAKYVTSGDPEESPSVSRHLPHSSSRKEAGRMATSVAADVPLWADAAPVPLSSASLSAATLALAAQAGQERMHGVACENVRARCAPVKRPVAVAVADANSPVPEEPAAHCPAPQAALPAAPPTISTATVIATGALSGAATFVGSGMATGIRPAGATPLAADPKRCQDDETLDAEALVGKRALLTGLVKITDFNGEWGKVLSYDAQTRRFVVEVLLASGSPVRAKLKRTNLIIPRTVSLTFVAEQDILFEEDDEDGEENSRPSAVGALATSADESSTAPVVAATTIPEAAQSSPAGGLATSADEPSMALIVVDASRPEVTMATGPPTSLNAAPASNACAEDYDHREAENADAVGVAFGGSSKSAPGVTSGSAAGSAGKAARRPAARRAPAAPNTPALTDAEPQPRRSSKASASAPSAEDAPSQPRRASNALSAQDVESQPRCASATAPEVVASRPRRASKALRATDAEPQPRGASKAPVPVDAAPKPRRASKAPPATDAEPQPRRASKAPAPEDVELQPRCASATTPEDAAPKPRRASKAPLATGAEPQPRCALQALPAAEAASQRPCASAILRAPAPMDPEPQPHAEGSAVNTKGCPAARRVVATPVAPPPTVAKSQAGAEGPATKLLAAAPTSAAFGAVGVGKPPAGKGHNASAKAAGNSSAAVVAQRIGPAASASRPSAGPLITEWAAAGGDGAATAAPKWRPSLRPCR